MQGNWKIVIKGGAEDGQTFEFGPEDTFQVGRSHTVQVRLLEPDVSGHHLELSVRDGVPVATNLSRFAAICKGRELLSGATVELSAGDTIGLGGSVTLVFAGVPFEADDVTARTVAFASEQQDCQTVLTEVPAPSVDSADGEEIDDSDLPTAFISDAWADGQGASAVVPNAPAVRVSTQMPDDDRETDTSFAGDESPDDEEEGRTIALETRIGSVEEIEAVKRALAAKRTRRRTVLVGGCVLFAAFLGVVWWKTKSDRETRTMAFPLKSDGSRDESTYIFRNEAGKALFEVDYPNNPAMSVTIAPDGTSMSVTSWMGRDRDVPFYLGIESVTRSEELTTDFLTSGKAWFRRTEELDGGYVFDERMKSSLRAEFLEDVYPASCQELTECGVRMLRFEYMHTWPDGRPWHGLGILFRSGDTLYVHRREIPEEYWERGRVRIYKDPNIAVYANFSLSNWQSRGLDDLPLTKSPAELLGEIRASLAKERVGEWNYIRKDFDALFMKTWRLDPRMRELALDAFRQFREMLRTFYYGKYNAFRNANENRADKKAARIRQDVKMVFTDPSERFYDKVNNGEVW